MLVQCSVKWCFDACPRCFSSMRCVRPLATVKCFAAPEMQKRELNYLSKAIGYFPPNNFPIPFSNFATQQIRWKFSKRKSKDEDEESDEEEDFDTGKDDAVSKIVTGHMTSLRADLVLKMGLGIARNKIETLFYESKIRVNGEKILKKSRKVNIGDEVDILKAPSPTNENLMIVSRVVVLSAKEHEDGEKLVVKMRRYKSLTVENLET